jgi:putative flippase GtrA
VLFPVRDTILSIIDFFHPPFSRFIDKQTFRYLACGGGNTVLDILIYYLSYNFVLDKQDVVVPALGWTIAPHIAAFFISFSVSFPIGFLLSKYVVFTQSNLRGRIQLFRYAVLVSMCILLNYFFLKVFVEALHLYPTLSKAITTAIIAVFSYISQRNFTFKVKTVVLPDHGDDED